MDMIDSRYKISIGSSLRPRVGEVGYVPEGVLSLDRDPMA
jgi:hypothetical protein